MQRRIFDEELRVARWRSHEKALHTSEWYAGLKVLLYFIFQSLCLLLLWEHDNAHAVLADEVGLYELSYRCRSEGLYERPGVRQTHKHSPAAILRLGFFRYFCQREIVTPVGA